MRKPWSDPKVFPRFLRKNDDTRNDTQHLERRIGLRPHFILKEREFIIGGDMCRDSEAMQLWDEIEIPYQRDFAANYVPVALKKAEIKGGDVRNITIEQFARTWPEFTRDKSDDRHVLRLSKPNRWVEKVRIDFDMGTFGPGHFSVYVGTANPGFTVELSSALCVRKRSWRFHNAELCNAAVAEVITLAKIVMPPFEEKIKNALNRSSRDLI